MGPDRRASTEARAKVVPFGNGPVCGGLGGVVKALYAAPKLPGFTASRTRHRPD
jgi:hypothetical protein